MSSDPPAHPAARRVTAFNGPWPLHDVSASRLIEQRALAAAPPGFLMARAGGSVARLALAMAPHAQRFQIWCGPGHNGGDGFVAARHLHTAGKTVQVELVADADRLPTDAACALREAAAAGVAIRSGSASQPDADLVIDALLGLGISRAPSGPLAAAIEHINRQLAPVLAVDLASGLHADTGARLGEQVVRAHSTLSLLSLKPGAFTHQGRDASGLMWFDDLGIVPDPALLTAWLTGPTQAQARRHESHKGSHGDVAIIGGAEGMEGAAWLAASAALSAGAGRVYCSLLGADGRAPSGRLELMQRRSWWRESPQTLARTTVVCGCGGAAAVRETLPALIAHAGRLVLDADALNAIAQDAALHQLLLRRADRALPTLLTPHPLEAARLLGCSAAEVQNDRLAAALALARKFEATALLKGSGTVIAAATGPLRINSTGNAALASPGTGDVLAGWAGGLWAQQPQASAAAIAETAAWQHGAAADGFASQWPSRPLRAEALIEWLLALDGTAQGDGSAPSARLG